MARPQRHEHPDTGALLAVLDGTAAELDAAHAARCAQCRAELARLRAVRAALAGLGPAAPPADGWQRVQNALERRRRRRRWLAPAATLAAAAAVAAIAVGLTSLRPAGNAPAAGATARMVAQSQALEQLLRVVNAGRGDDPRVAAAAGEAERRIARIDQALNLAGAAGADPRLTDGLWRERVRLLAGLVQVRSAPTPRTDYQP